MRKIIFTTIFTFCCFALSFANGDESTLTANFKTGDPGIRSISAMTFGPSGILFLGDSEQAKLVAIETRDIESPKSKVKVELKNLDAQVAALMGTTADQIMIIDMAVNPMSHNVYLAAQKKDGTPALLKLADGNLTTFDLANASYSNTSISNAIAADAKDRRGRSQRKWSISDMGFHDGKLLVTGLSNEEFSSTFRSIPFPFEKRPQFASLEIYHAAHGKYETHSPVKTFMPFEMNGKSHVIASYTCTPLVVFPMTDLKAGQHIKGKTVAELGNRNSPLDIISFNKDGKDFILMANSHRPLMKINAEEAVNFESSLTEPVKGNSETAGVNYLSLPYMNVLQLDKLNDENIVIIQRTASGELNLTTVNQNRL